MAAKRNTRRQAATQHTRRDAVLSEEMLDAIERRFCDGANGAARRTALVTLLKSDDWLFRAVAEDRETAIAFADIAQCASAYSHRLREVADLVDRAATRINVALCTREDMDAIVAEARHG